MVASAPPPSCPFARPISLLAMCPVMIATKHPRQGISVHPSPPATTLTTDSGESRGAMGGAVGFGVMTADEPICSSQQPSTGKCASAP